MHDTLKILKKHLGKLADQVQAVMQNDEPMGNIHNNWAMPGLTRAELIEHIQSIVKLIDERGSESIGDSDARLKDYVRRLEHLTSFTVPHLWNGHAGQAVSVFMLTLEGLSRALEPSLIRDERSEATASLKRIVTKLRSMEARVNGLDPRTTDLETMVGRIENAQDAADQLPTDLQALTEARQKIEDLAKDATKDQGRILSIREKADDIDIQLQKSVDDAVAVLSRCEAAYSAATSVGLAAAFAERSGELARSMWLWVGGLILALIAGGYFGSAQLHSLSDLVKVPDASSVVVTLNLLLSLLSVAAPVWFSWLATKQIGQRFRLAEDYAFKASVSRAYEGYRREAARVDKDMEARLLASALMRLDELPLRLVETDSHGSPWHELASSDIVKKAMSAVPGFADQVKNLASRAIDAARPSKSKIVAEPESGV